jgi:hypothetical protein
MKAKRISGKHTQAELADAVIFPVNLTAAQKEHAAKQLATAREKGQKEMTNQDRLALQVFQLKFHLEDYLANKEFDPKITFGYFLKHYVELLRIKRKTFASEISIDETLLSQFINMHRMPPEYITVRLEIHSNNTIPATHWFKLVEKQKEYELRTDKEMRRKENKYVLQRISVSL